jgi:hypothetical protein
MMVVMQLQMQILPHLLSFPQPQVPALLFQQHQMLLQARQLHCQATAAAAAPRLCLQTTAMMITTMTMMSAGVLQLSHVSLPASLANATCK